LGEVCCTSWGEAAVASPKRAILHELCKKLFSWQGCRVQSRLFDKEDGSMEALWAAQGCEIGEVVQRVQVPGPQDWVLGLPRVQIIPIS
jgi:hypothetical protein